MEDGSRVFRLLLVFVFFTWVLAPIRVGTGPTEFYFIPGYNFTLIVKFTLEPKDTIYSGTWKKDNGRREIVECQLHQKNSWRDTTKEQGNCVLQEANISLTLRNFLPEDVGNYSLELVSEAGETENVQFTAKLYESVSTPSIEWNEQFNKGSNQTFICKIEKGTYPQFNWEKDGETLTNDSRHSISENGIILTITHINESDCGFYKCVIKNDRNQEEKQFNITNEKYKLCQEDTYHVPSNVCCIIGLLVLCLIGCAVWKIRKCKSSQQVTHRHLCGDVPSECS
ncbi:hepatocyte cell adhesion molecule-like isoform X2 [Rhincodon typus]|uniref:hepatocyte cell adhesion molecule-like isoform X2 n=1 Tax=Rhincodon typus TaxID=259920 RepID=UPI00202EFAF9|nr:hepatocyte cell adhesion molecule-like isoform X2 [Rhincodon typus]